VPKSKMVLGIDLVDSTAQQKYSNLATTNGSISTSSTPGSIPLSSGLSAAIPAGKVVLASTENPPAHYEILTTSGAAQGATSIPITGSVTGNGAYTFPSGSDVQNDSAGPWDCGNIAQYATQQGLMGTMVWDIHADQQQHNSQFPCFDQIAANGG